MLCARFATYLALFNNPGVLSSRGVDQRCGRVGPPIASKRFDYILFLDILLAVRCVGARSPSPAKEEEEESGDDSHTEDTAYY